MEGVSLLRSPLHWWFSGVLRGWLLRRTGRRGGRTEDVDTHWPWRLRSPLKVPSHSDTQSSCRICCGSGGTLLSCAVYAASKRAKKRRGSKRVQEEEEWGRERESTNNVILFRRQCCSQLCRAMKAHHHQEAPREVFLLTSLCVMRSETPW